MLTLIRFFRVVAPVPALLVATFVVVTAVAAVAIATDASYTAGMLRAVMVLQLFAASSGFAGNARRGYYDLLLTGGERRLVIALVHWAMSVAAGVGSWITIAACEAIATLGQHGVGIASGTIAAMFIVSTTPWALTAALPRFSGAIGWVMVTMMMFGMEPGVNVPAALIDVVYPLGMIGRNVGPGMSQVVLPTSVAVAAVAAALVWIERADVPLEASQ